MVRLRLKGPRAGISSWKASSKLPCHQWSALWAPPAGSRVQVFMHFGDIRRPPIVPTSSSIIHSSLEVCQWLIVHWPSVLWLSVPNEAGFLAVQWQWSNSLPQVCLFYDVRKLCTNGKTYQHYFLYIWALCLSLQDTLFGLTALL